MHSNTKKYILQNQEGILKKEAFIMFHSHLFKQTVIKHVSGESQAGPITTTSSIKDKLFTTILNNSIYYNYRHLVLGLIAISYSTNNKLNISYIKKTKKKSEILGLKFEKRIYFMNQFNNISSFNYKNNFISCILSLNTISKYFPLNINKKIKKSK